MGLTFLEFNKYLIQPSSNNNEKIVLSCPCYGHGYLELWVLEIWVKHDESGSVKLKAGAHRLPTTNSWYIGFPH